MAMTKERSLDDWYKVINGVFIDRNFERHPAIIFAHLVEVVTGLSLIATEKKKKDVTPENFIPKSFAWWLALCGKLGIRSVEDMLWAKFPGICPYCKLNPHKDDPCLRNKLENPFPDWKGLKKIADKTYASKPRSFREWQLMFFSIYGSSQSESYEKVFSRLNEEIGELAEAVRAFDLAPGLFFSEAPDVFAWLMKVQNLLDSKKLVGEEARGEFVTSYFVKAYPDRCNDCGGIICRCPTILPSTLRRIAKEAPEEIEFFNSKPPLLSSHEIKELFEKGEDELRYGKFRVKVEGEVVREIHKSIRQLLHLTDANSKRIIEFSAQIVDAAEKINDLTATQRITNESLRELAEAIAKLPSEQRSAVLSFFTNLASAPWIQLLMQMVNDLAKQI